MDVEQIVISAQLSVWMSENSVNSFDCKYCWNKLKRFLKIEIVVMNASILRDYTKISHY